MVVDIATGTIVQRLDCDEYGRVLQDTNPGFQPFGFAGGIWDRDVGLVRFGRRDYDPVSGRSTAKDLIGFGGGDSGLYLYVGSVPTVFVDPNGLSPKKGDKGRWRGNEDFWDFVHPEKEKGGPDFDDSEVESLKELWEKEGRPDPKNKKPKRGGVREIQACMVDPIDLAIHTPITPPQVTGPGGFSEAGPLLIGTGAAIIFATLLEDVLTGGVGLWNDPATITPGGSLILQGLR